MQKEQLPFHESLVNAINEASSGDASVLLPLIEKTKIPKGHDAIIAAIQDKWGEGYWKHDVARIVLGLREQERELSTKPAGENKKATALMIIINKMIARYQNYNADNLDEGIFELHNIAKAVSWAKDDAELQSAIKDL